MIKILSKIDHNFGQKRHLGGIKNRSQSPGSFVEFSPNVDTNFTYLVLTNFKYIK